jgi:hypothetical protein
MVTNIGPRSFRLVYHKEVGCMFSIQKRCFRWAQWRLALIAALTVVAMSATLSVPFASKALASSGQPGEWNYYNPEHVGGAVLYSSSQVSEARDTDGNLLQVWRADDYSGAVWMSINGNSPFTLGSTQTAYAPTVVPWGSGGWMVFHVGGGGNIYYTHVYNNNSWDGSWFAVPGQTTATPVAAAQLGYGSRWVQLIYRSSSGPGEPYYDAIWSTTYSGNSFYAPFVLGGATSPTAPAAAYNPVSRQVFVVARGTDNNVWLTSGGNNSNATWYPLDVYTYSQPSIAASSDGNMLVSYLDTSNHPNYRAYNSGGYPLDSFTQDITGWQTFAPVFLSVVGQAIYAILTGYNNQVYYKEAYSG